MCNDIADEGEIGGSVHFRNHKGSQIWRFEYFFEVGKRQTRTHRVYAHRSFSDPRGDVLIYRFPDKSSSFSLAAGCDAVLEIVGYAVRCQGTGFIKELLWRARY